MRIKNHFPSPTELQRIKTLEKYDKLYDGRHQEVLLLHEIIRKQYKNVADMVYLGHAIPAKISDFYGDFVQGDVDRMTLDYVDDDANLETFNQIVHENDVPERVNDWATDQSVAGYEVLIGYVDKTGKFRIQDVDPDQYFPQPDGSVIFATYFRDWKNANPLKEEKQQALLLYTQHYALEGEIVVITRQVWSTDPEGRATEDLGEEILRLYFDIDPEERIEGMDRLPIVQIDNGRQNKWGFGKSDYHDIMPQLAEVNERRTHIATQLLKNLDAKLELPDIDALKNEDGTLKQFEYLMRASKEDPEMRYVTNENPLIEATEKHITAQLQMISYVTDVPMWALLDSSAPERVETVKIKLFGAIRKTTRKRAKMLKGIEDIVQIGFAMLGKEMNGSLVMQFSDVLPSDELLGAQVEEIKVRAGITSRRSSMKRIENYTEEELDAEEEQLKREGITSGAVNPNDAPSL